MGEQQKRSEEELNVSMLIIKNPNCEDEIVYYEGILILIQKWRESRVD